MQLIFRTLGLTMLAFVIVACGTTVNIEDGNLVVNSNFSLTETMLNSGDTANISFSDSDFIRNAEFDIQEGQLVVSGELLCSDSSRDDGSVTILMNATDTGFINVEISEVSVNCDYDQSVITRAQEELANGLAEAAQGLEDSNATLTFEEVTLSDDTLTIAIEVRAPINGGN